MNDDGSIIKTISWHKINCILIFMPQIHDVVDMYSLTFSLLSQVSFQLLLFLIKYSISSKSIISLSAYITMPRKSNSLICISLLLKNHPLSPLNVNCCKVFLIHSFRDLMEFFAFFGEDFFNIICSLYCYCIRFINPIGMSFKVQ